MKRFFLRILNAVLPRRADDRLAREVASHLTMLEDDFQRRGMTPDDARLAARRAFGGVEQAKELHRDARSFVWLDDARRDVRYAAQLLRRNPLFALTAALSLAIGIGADTTIFTVANGLLFRAPVGVVQPGRVIDILSRMENGRGAFNNISYPDFLDIRQRATMLEGLYASPPVAQPMSVGGPGGAERIFGIAVTTNYFAVLGARPAAGRLFFAGDSEEPGASPIVVMSHGLWTRRFNNDPAIIGQTLQINGHAFTAVGVAPEGFHGTSVVLPDLWMPLGMAPVVMPSMPPLTSREGGGLIMGGRLKPGVSVPQAAAELDTIARALEREYPDQNRGTGLRVTASSPIPGNVLPVAPFLALLMGIVSLVLIIACTNVASVLLARATARRREIAVRLAMGAGRARLVRQLLTETMMLFVLGGGAGLLLARGMTSLLASLLPALPLPVDVSLSLDGRVIAFTTGLSLMAALLSGLAPALQASKADVVSALKDDAQGPSGRSWLRHAFVVGQVAVSLVLVVGAGLFVRALQKGSSIDPGFDSHGVELASLDLSLAGYTDATGSRFARELLDRIRDLADVQGATLATSPPMGAMLARLPGLTVPGVPPPNGQPFFEPDSNAVEPGYFATMRIPLVSGRDFDAADRNGAKPVAIVGEAAARLFWPGQEAVGKYMRLEAGPFRKASAVKTLLVIGVARDVKNRSLRDDAPRAFVYTPLQQQYRPRVTIIARTTRGQRIADEIRALVASMNPNLPIIQAQTLEDTTALGLLPQRVAASVSGTLGLVGVLLAAIGIYGVTAYAVTRRTREIGIRLAMGAQRADVVGMVLRQGMALTVIGAAIGLLLAAGASRLLTTFLFGIPAIDPVTFTGAAVLFTAIGLVACYVPARRATRVDPTIALRYE